MSAPNPPTVNELPLSGNGTLDFQWYAPDSGAPVDSYTLSYTDELGNSGSYPGLTGTYAQITGLVNGRTYTFNVTAVNTNGSSTAVYFIPFQPGSAVPSIVPSTSVTKVEPNNMLVSWTGATATDATIFWYVIESQSNNASDPVISRTAGGTQRSLLIDGLNPDSTYSFSIQAVNCPGYGPATTTSSIAFVDPGEAKLATYMGMSASTMNATTVHVDINGNVYMRVYAAATSALSIYNYSSSPVSGGAVQTTLYGTITGLSGQTSYLIKYNSTGQVQWATILPNLVEKLLNEVPPLTTDSDGNIYVVGNAISLTVYSYSSLTAGAIVTTTFGSYNFNSGNASYPGIYLIKYNSSGVAQWVTVIRNSGNSPEFIYPNVRCDSQNNAYVGFSGSSAAGDAVFYNYTSVTSGTINVTEFGRYTFSAYAGFLVKYNSSGTTQWVSALENIAADVSCHTALTIDSNDFIYFGAQAGVSRTATIKSYSSKSGTTISMSTFGSYAIGATGWFIVVKYNSSGVAQWSTYIISSLVSRLNLMTDSSNNVIVANTANGAQTITIYRNTSGSGTGVTVYGTITITANAPYIVKYNSSGTVQWATYIKSGGTIGLSSVDSSNNVYISCNVSNAISPQNYTSAPSGGGAVGLTQYGNIPYAGGTGDDTYLVKYDSSGITQWGTRIAGTTTDRRPDCATDATGNVYITGIYTSNPLTIMNFTAAPVNSTANATLETYGTLPDFSTSGGENVFLVKYVR